MASNASAAGVALRARQLVLVLGAGPGLGYALARRFALLGHPVALLSRNTNGNLDRLAKKLNDDADALAASPARPLATAYRADCTDEKSLVDAFAKIQADAKANGWAVRHAVFNSLGGFARAPFLDTSLDQLRDAIGNQCFGAFIFAQLYLRALQSQPEWNSTGPTPPFLFFTGATASLKASANFAAFAAAKSALRSLASSLAREWGAKGVHVAHAIVDGLIDTERVKGFAGEASAQDQRLDPDAMATSIVNLALQPKNCFTFEIDLRPAAETW